MLGDLVQTTDGKRIVHPPMRCPNGAARQRRDLGGG